MKIYKKLAGQTVVYGLGTVVPRLLNYSILTVYYTRLFSVTEFGVLSELYAYVTFLLVLLTYGMETGFFRFARDGKQDIVYSSILISVFTTSVLFFTGILLFNKSIAGLLEYQANTQYIVLLGAIVAIDAFSAIPFAKLRKEERSIRFSALKIINVLLTIFCVILFYEILPYLIAKSDLRFYIHLRSDVNYVLISNLIASLITLLLLSNEIFTLKLKFNWSVLKPIWKYSWPLLIAGLGGTINETMDRILLRHYIPGREESLYALGIYSANYKIAILLMIFIQMFRYAAEPFYFNYHGNKDQKFVFGQIMRLFIIIVQILMLGILLYLHYFKFFIDEKFHEGLIIVPIVLLSYLFYGIFFNLSVWYKLSKRTLFGAFITVLGAVITIVINIVYIRTLSYMASAIAHFIVYFIMMVITFIVGQHYFPIDYKVKRCIEYFIISLFIFVFCKYILDKYLGFNFITDSIKFSLIVIYGYYGIRREQLFSLKKYFYAGKNS